MQKILTNRTKYDTIIMDYCIKPMNVRYKPTETSYSMNPKRRDDL